MTKNIHESHKSTSLPRPHAHIKSAEPAKPPKPTGSSRPPESPTPREQIIIRGGIISIAVNFFLALFELIVGLLSNSIAIISEAAHGLLDSVSGFIITVSGKLSKNRPTDHAHRIEQVATTIIILIIFATGITTLLESIEKVLTKEEVDYTAPTIIILLVTIIGKLLLGLFLRAEGRKIHSSPLLASGIESLNDSLISVAVLASALIYLIWQIDLSAYLGIGISLLILGFGFSLMLGHGHHIKRTPHCHHH